MKLRAIHSLLPTVPALLAMLGSLAPRALAQIGNQRPTISCPSPVVVPCQSRNATSVALNATVRDANGDRLMVRFRVGTLVVKQPVVPAGGPPTQATVSMTRPFRIGTTLVRISASDGRGAEVALTVAVIVQDTEPPVVQCT